MKKRLRHLSAIKPKSGCNKDEVKFETDIKSEAIVIVMPIFAAIKGIIGFKNPEYTSSIKCPALSAVTAFLSSFSVFSANVFKFLSRLYIILFSRRQ